jgi:hypothetical protein
VRSGAAVRRAVGVALVVLGAACGLGRGARRASAETPAQPDSLFVEVINDNYYDARLHLIYEGGGRLSLGTVPGNERQPVHAVPWYPRRLTVEVRLVIGGGVYRSQPIDAAKGDILQIRVPANLETSGFFRRVSR